MLHAPGQHTAHPRSGLCRAMHKAMPRTIFEKEFPQKKLSISIRQLCINTDVEFIFDWVNQEYAKRFWQMDGRPKQQLRETYKYILSSDFAQSFVALLHGTPVAQLDVYHALQDEVSLLYDAQKGDYGVHFLMAPNKRPISSLSSCVFQSFIEFLFTYNEVQRIIGEPDAENQHANKLVKRLGFQFQKQITMSYKTANLYFCTRDNFHAAILPEQEYSNE